MTADSCGCSKTRYIPLLRSPCVLVILCTDDGYSRQGLLAVEAVSELDGGMHEIVQTSIRTPGAGILILYNAVRSSYSVPASHRIVSASRPPLFSIRKSEVKFNSCQTLGILVHIRVTNSHNNSSALHCLRYLEYGTLRRPSLVQKRNIRRQVGAPPRRRTESARPPESVAACLAKPVQWRALGLCCTASSRRPARPHSAAGRSLGERSAYVQTVRIAVGLKGGAGFGVSAFVFFRLSS